jgi:hypothetical protein
MQKTQNYHNARRHATSDINTINASTIHAGTKENMELPHRRPWPCILLVTYILLPCRKHGTTSENMPEENSPCMTTLLRNTT